MKVDNLKTEESKKFNVNSSYKGFLDRQKNVFDQLSVLEHSTRTSLLQNDTPMEVNDHDNMALPASKSTLRHLQGTESLFKKPQTRPLKHFKSLLNRSVPDYQINPHKWTKYTLDVPKEDMSEKANTSAAMSFLKELELRNQQSLDSPIDDNPTKFVFKKVSRPSEQEKPTVSFRNSKVVMPEYVIGQKITKSKSKVGTVKLNSNKAEVKLDHISTGDDENEDNDN
ncbi:hypothetical protein RN001_009455 [Aquatica leii]|uniref:U5 small nuclear ribonucleoprotein TSSC4 n=1 Tax=Aquatica leii TaxID=1421715 RepID=A0AAN7PTS6_9COLE|nr:hypothetical protein RN001_009455 [Aquatica leii]